MEESAVRRWKGTSRYEVIGTLGEGGMGIVYEASDRERQERVALKTLRNYDAANIYRLKQEFRTLADVSHPNLVRLYELVATEHDEAFFAMELVDGADFIEYVRGGPTPLSPNETEIVTVANTVRPPPGAASRKIESERPPRRQAPDFDRLPLLGRCVQETRKPSKGNSKSSPVG